MMTRTTKSFSRRVCMTLETSRERLEANLDKSLEALTLRTLHDRAMRASYAHYTRLVTYHLFTGAYVEEDVELVVHVLERNPDITRIGAEVFHDPTSMRSCLRLAFDIHVSVVAPTVQEELPLETPAERPRRMHFRRKQTED